MKQTIVILCLGLFLGSCSSPSYLAKPKDFKYRVKGLFIKIQSKENKRVYATGEIIEVLPNTIKILPLKKPLITIRKDEISKAEIIVALTSDHPKEISAWAALINLAAAGHGIYALASVPINAIASISISENAAHSTYRVKYPGVIAWEEINKFARFPQGIPPKVNEDLIR